MIIFGRGFWSQVVLTLSSNEVLGIIDGGYVEDYYGTGGQLTLRCIETTQEFPMLMGELTGEEAAPHEVFRGYYNLDLMPNGHYLIEGRVSDIVGNKTILSAFRQPDGSEQVLTLEFEVIPGLPKSHEHITVVNVDVAMDLTGRTSRISVGNRTKRLDVAGGGKRIEALPEPRRIDATD